MSEPLSPRAPVPLIDVTGHRLCFNMSPSRDPETIAQGCPWSPLQKVPPFVLSSGQGLGQPSISPMGKQYNKVIKRRRRRAYLERVKSRIKSARGGKKKVAKK